MKKYFLALAVGSLLIAIPVAYGTAAEQNMSASEVNNRSAQTEVINNTVNIDKVMEKDSELTGAQFINMLASEGILIDILHLDNDKQVTIKDAAVSMVSIMQAKGINLTPFTNQRKEIDPVEVLNDFGILDTSKFPSADNPLDSKTSANMVKNLSIIINAKADNQNCYGVNYIITPEANGQHNIELLWGRKSSSGYAIKIEETVVEDDILYVKYSTSEPQTGSAYLTVITYPSDAITISMEDIPSKVVLVKSK
ncbi:MAG: protease complex subunit PrcB family protein [Firmicutes bacterium]|nr:protease complex subunit PrcB family protein [Bacillota bacterium]